MALLGLLSTIACGGDQVADPSGSLSSQARSYLNQLIGHMQANSINRLTIDWSQFRTRVLDAVPEAQTIPDTYPAIRLAIELLDDGHSYYRTTSGMTISVPKRTCSPSGGGQPTLPTAIGYVKVDAFAGLGAEATAYATEIQRSIMLADRDDLAGWIVDLQGNGGGNMWPMVAGLGPVLGEGVLGYFIDPTGVEEAWEYRNGSALLNGAVAERVEAPYHLRREQPRVAVLIDNGVTSSGEAVVIAFRGRGDVRSFGVPTCGLSTAVAGFFLTDGALLGLTTSVMADRNRTKYGNAVSPDEVVTDPAQRVARAVAWLQTGN